jgi:hypothetical protein
MDGDQDTTIPATPCSRYTYSALEESRTRVLNIAPGQFDDDIIIDICQLSLENDWQEIEEDVANDTDDYSYEALSYVWGEENPPGRVWIGNACSAYLEITPNLESALRYLRYQDRRRTLWIDAICIDQQNVPERNSQVQMMGSVYSNAQKVLIWLGLSEGNECLDEFDHMLDYPRSPHDLASDKIRNWTCYQLLSRSWFERTWTVQELALSRHDPIVHVGKYSFSWEDIWDQAQIPLFLESVSDETFTNVQDGMRLLQDVRVATHLQNQDNSERVLPTLAHQVARTLHLSATDPRDKIYGLLGISSLKTGVLVPDYNKSCQEVFSEALALMLHSRNPSIYVEAPLRPLGDAQITDYNDDRKRPSWLPNFTYVSKLKAMEKRYRTGFATLVDFPYDQLDPGLDFGPHQRLDHLSQSLPQSLIAAEVNLDKKSLTTYGLYRGSIIWTSGDTLKSWEFSHIGYKNPLYQIYHNHLAPKNVNLKSFLFALLPEEERSMPQLSYRSMFKFNAFVNFMEKGRVTEGSFYKYFQNTKEKIGLDMNNTRFVVEATNTKYFHDIKNLIESDMQNRLVFLTDTGEVGVSYHEDLVDGIQTGDHLVGLFGVNFPFILSRNREDNSSSKEHTTHRIVNVARVASQTWGHEFLGNGPVQPFTCYSDDYDRVNLGKYKEWKEKVRAERGEDLLGGVPLQDWMTASKKVEKADRVKLPLDAKWKDFKKHGMQKYVVV